MSSFVIHKKDISHLLGSMQPICTKRTPIEAMNSILFQVGPKELILKSTDLEVSLQASCHVHTSQLTEQQIFLVPGRRIYDVVRELDNEIACTITDSQLHIKSGSVNVSLNIKDSNEFPPFPERIENLMHVRAATLKEMLDSVSFLIPQNNSNHALNGLYLEIDADGMSMTSTDGHCLARVVTDQCSLDEPRQWLIPKRAVLEMKKIIDTTDDETIFFGVCGNQFVVSGEVFNFFTKVLADPFPDYRPIIEKDTFIAASLDRARLVKTLRRAACLLSGHFLAAKFQFAPDQIEVALNNKEVGTLNETVPAQGVGEAVTMRFYPPYLLQGMQTFNQDTVQFYLKNHIKPIIFESTDEQLQRTYVVMPVAHGHE